MDISHELQRIVDNFFKKHGSGGGVSTLESTTDADLGDLTDTMAKHAKDWPTDGVDAVIKEKERERDSRPAGDPQRDVDQAVIDGLNKGKLQKSQQ